ncbi:MAG: sensor histidine kinase [Proteobacteria bacterium]|nr:sensor histidine kinase [Pseudomonadota bacterium]
MSGNSHITFGERINRLRRAAQYRPSWGLAAIAAVFVAAGALAFDALTPQTVSVGMFYVGLVLIGFWFPSPKAALVLALLATPLVIAGYWITIPDNTPAWEVYLNRALAIGAVWITAGFVWHIRVLEKNLQRQMNITDALSREMNHRVGNHLQLVTSFLRQQAHDSPNEELRRALGLAESRVMVIGKIQRLLSHSEPSQMVESRAFLKMIVGEVRSALLDSNQVKITVQADSAELTSMSAIVLGAMLLELTNNALKYAFPDGMKGTLLVRFSVSDHKHIVEFEDDGIGIPHGCSPDGFGIRSVEGLARLLEGSMTCGPARQSNARPGTKWRAVIPA